jgi:prepilin-type N-terminal cleavage/methylation domain-containing protein
MNRPRQHRLHRRRRAFSLLELLVAIGLLGFFAVAATQLFRATVRISHTTAQRQDAAGSFETAIGVLRGDAWTAAEIAAPDATTAKLGKVTWTARGETLTRDAGDGSRPRTWPVPAGVTFLADNASLVLRVPPAKDERGGDVRMVSESKILSKLSAS